MKIRKPLILVVLDGWGIAPPGPGNPILQANLPTVARIERLYPGCLLQASGISVGLPWGEAGNSEAGHLNIGAGKIVYQYMPRIILSIRDGSFFRNPAFLKAVEHVSKKESALHLMGIISSGAVHSYIDHLYGLFDLAKEQNLPRVYLHIFTDGRDAKPTEAAKFIQNLQERIEKEYPQIQIATIMGRFFAMDRNENWERTKKAYRCLTKGEGKKITDIKEYLENSYKNGITDEMIEPAVLEKSKIPSFAKASEGKQNSKSKTNPEPKILNGEIWDTRIKNGDGVIFFNFREDSARQLTRAFVDIKFDKFFRIFLDDLCFVSMTQYDPDLKTEVAFFPPEINQTLGKILSKAGKTQLRIAETEKYAHITYFFNGLKENPYPGEQRILVPSLAVSHYDFYPQMRTQEITDQALKNLENYDFVLISFANPDMIGHTGNIKAAVLALEKVDQCLSQILEAVLGIRGILIVTSDHGNIEEMLDWKTGTILTEHSTSPVPFYLIGRDFEKEKSAKELAEFKKESPKGILADIAPTILELMEIAKPEEMTGQSLLAALDAR